MTDNLISRQAVIEELHRCFSSDGFDSDGYWWHSARVIQAIANVPSVPRITGQWQYTNTTRWDAKDKDGEQELEISIVSASCSVCGRWAEQVNNFPPYMQYNNCPHCGARMEKTNSE